MKARHNKGANRFGGSTRIMKYDADYEKDFSNRFPKPPKMPDDVVSDPEKRKMWNEYWKRVHDDWASFLKDMKNKDMEGGSNWLRRQNEGNNENR